MDMHMAVTHSDHIKDNQMSYLEPRQDWTLDEVHALFEMSFYNMLFLAQKVHRHNFNATQIQLSTLMNIKTGACTEDCKYCSQSSHYNTGLKANKLAAKEDVLRAAQQAKENGADRFCMGAAWRELKDRDVEKICDIVASVRELGLETCLTLGMLTAKQAAKLKASGLDYYNHNIDTSKDYYSEVITTRAFEDRLDTLKVVRKAGLSVCCGAIIGLGEDRQDRASMIHTLATLPSHPESVPINKLVPIKGTPLGDQDEVDIFDLVRTIAVARITMPRSVIRLSAGRNSLSNEGQALCFLAGANSCFYGEELLTTENPQHERDDKLFQQLGLRTIVNGHN